MSATVDLLRLSRLQFLAGPAAAGAVGWTAGLWTPARARELGRTLATVADPTGTTLEATVVPLAAGPAGYRRLGDGPGWPIMVREELRRPRAGREDRRRPLAAVAHLTDIHVIDAQSPGRVEFLDRYADPPSTPSRRPPVPPRKRSRPSWPPPADRPCPYQLLRPLRRWPARSPSAGGWGATLADSCAPTGL